MIKKLLKNDKKDENYFIKMHTCDFTNSFKNIIYTIIRSY